ncbi:MAG TPA: hypothetical protein DIV79_07870 [Opitutae bacterium]|nr:hypothetical protein [Opitutae bacterium]
MEKSLEDWAKEIEGDLGRKLSKNENGFLESLAELLERLDWKDTLNASDFALLDQRILSVEKDRQRGLTQELWISIPKNEYTLWQYIAVLFEQRNIPIPDFLKNQTDISGTKSGIDRRNREKETRLWKNRLGNLSQKRDFDHSGKLDIRLKLQGRAFRWECRSNRESEYKQLPVSELTSWLEKDYSFLNRFSPESLPICSLFQQYYRSSGRGRIDLDQPEDCAFLNELLHRTDIYSKLVGKDENPLSVGEQRLKWTGSEAGPNASSRYELRLIFEDGTPAPTPLIYLAGRNPLYMHGHQIFPGPMLLQPDDDPNTPFLIPEEAMESPDGLLFLRKQELGLPEHLAGKVLHVPMESLLYCHLQKRSSDGADEPGSIVVNLVSVSRDRENWFSLTEQGWIAAPNRESGAPPSKPDKGTLFEYPQANNCLSILQEFNLEETDSGEWLKPIDSDFPNAFREWIQSLPSEIQIIADDDLEALVENKPASRYSLQIEAGNQQDWFDVRLKPEFLDTQLSEEEHQILLRANGDFVYLPNKGWKRFQPDVSMLQKELYLQLGFSEGDATGDKQSFHAMQLADAALEEAMTQAQAKSIRKRAKEITAQTPNQLPKGIVTQLRPYQEEGFRFLAFLSKNRFGGVLADDMGLGKTLQTLTWLTWLKLNRNSDQPFKCLVVCPKSVVHVWIQEIGKHSSLLTIRSYDPNDGNPAEEADILVANYSQLRIKQQYFLSKEWTAVILDEGQNIKNPQSKTAKTARSLNAEYRIALTGTPLENRVLDLWSLFAFAMPGLLGSQSAFKRQYRESDPSVSERLHNRVRHFMLRRSKAQVAPDLPERIEETLSCQMEREQLTLYNAELKQAQSHISSINTDGDFARKRFNILSSLLRLRQICCHPRLVDPAYADVGSAKLEAVIELVSDLKDEGHKVLIFSQFVEMLEIIRTELNERQCRHLMITGKTVNREQLVDQFQDDDGITAFLLSLKAAGSGLNLTAASYVILYDPWWNPAVEAQAIDRAHRIGQENTVNAYRLIARDSIEDKIQSLQLKKESLANEVVQEESLNQILDLDRLKSILTD